MARITLDNFIEAFAANLVTRGQYLVRLNDPEVRDGLERVYAFIAESLKSPNGEEDKEWRRSLVAIRNLFQPSSIGAFDKFEALMRAKQVYLTDHPNPYYQDILIKLPQTAAKEILDDLAPSTARLVEDTVDRYMTPA